MPTDATFTCPICGHDFTAAWEFGDTVTCPHCGTQYETEYETNADDDIIGPWLGTIIQKEHTMPNDTTNKVSFTPGPWKLQGLETAHNGYDGWKTFAVRSATTNVCLAVVGEVDHYHEPDHEANAALSG